MIAKERTDEPNFVPRSRDDRACPQAAEAPAVAGPVGAVEIGPSSKVSSGPSSPMEAPEPDPAMCTDDRQPDGEGHPAGPRAGPGSLHEGEGHSAGRRAAVEAGSLHEREAHPAGPRAAVESGSVVHVEGEGDPVGDARPRCARCKRVGVLATSRAPP